MPSVNGATGPGAASIPADDTAAPPDATGPDAGAPAATAPAASALPSRADVLARLTAAPADPGPIVFPQLPASAALGERMHALMGELGDLRARAEAAGGELTLDAGEAHELCASVFGATFPAGRALGATMEADGRFAVRFDGGFAWSPPGPNPTALHFADNNDAHELRGSLEPAGDAIDVGPGNGLQATFWRVDLDRFYLDGARVWVKPHGHDAQQIG